MGNTTLDLALVKQIAIYMREYLSGRKTIEDSQAVVVAILKDKTGQSASYLLEIMFSALNTAYDKLFNFVTKIYTPKLITLGISNKTNQEKVEAIKALIDAQGEEIKSHEVFRQIFDLVNVILFTDDFISRRKNNPQILEQFQEYSVIQQYFILSYYQQDQEFYSQVKQLYDIQPDIFWHAATKNFTLSCLLRDKLFKKADATMTRLFDLINAHFNTLLTLKPTFLHIWKASESNCQMVQVQMDEYLAPLGINWEQLSQNKEFVKLAKCGGTKGLKRFLLPNEYVSEQMQRLHAECGRLMHSI